MTTTTLTMTPDIEISDVSTHTLKTDIKDFKNIEQREMFFFRGDPCFLFPGDKVNFMGLYIH